MPGHPRRQDKKAADDGAKREGVRGEAESADGEAEGRAPVLVVGAVRASGRGREGGSAPALLKGAKEG